MQRWSTSVEKYLYRVGRNGDKYRFDTSLGCWKSQLFLSLVPESVIQKNTRRSFFSWWETVENRFLPVQVHVKTSFSTTQEEYLAITRWFILAFHCKGKYVSTSKLISTVAGQAKHCQKHGVMRFQNVDEYEYSIPQRVNRRWRSHVRRRWLPCLQIFRSLSLAGEKNS